MSLPTRNDENAEVTASRHNTTLIDPGSECGYPSAPGTGAQNTAPAYPMPERPDASSSIGTIRGPRLLAYFSPEKYVKRKKHTVAIALAEEFHLPALHLEHKLSIEWRIESNHQAGVVIKPAQQSTVLDEQETRTLFHLLSFYEANIMDSPTLVADEAALMEKCSITVQEAADQECLLTALSFSDPCLILPPPKLVSFKLLVFQALEDIEFYYAACFSAKDGKSDSLTHLATKEDADPKGPALCGALPPQDDYGWLLLLTTEAEMETNRENLCPACLEQWEAGFVY